MNVLEFVPWGPSQTDMGWQIEVPCEEQPKRVPPNDKDIGKKV